MKHLNKLLVAVTMVMGLSSQAQDSNNKWAISFGVNAIDYRSSAGPDFVDHFSQPFKVSDNWNILPSVSYIGVNRYVGSGFIVGLTGSINQIDKFVIPVKGQTPDKPDYAAVNPGDLMYYGIDLTASYSFMELIKSKTWEPLLTAGGGYTFLGDESYGTVNLGGGLNIWFTENVGLNLGTAYKKSFGDRTYADGKTPDAPSYTQWTAGLTFKFGAKDTDGDGVYDKDDACPEVAGLKQFNGCPDSDSDGIEDSKDKCPNVAGTAEYQGCPDTDGDGVADPDDACPDVKGLKQFKGCPDTDGDGVTDASDKCPNEAGPASNGGCPIKDADKDGVPDLDDACPTVPGPASNKGCPEVTEQVIQDLKVQARAVYFVTGKAVLETADKGATDGRLEAIKEILKNYPNAKFAIEGHTDNTGSAKLNQKLSEARAKVVMDKLIEKGVNPANLTSAGYGSSKPVATNKTKEGRALNRRTEIRHIGSVYEGKL
ncbi:OmpA family protein [Flavobacterium gilvum]|uniref:Cell envelope biogenesis protein OmpA n=1 Tax=Flavobacterium gilvum TaxID=1492737 RepID=A0AAC9I259_9FLAO|nr:OmpA family protein [Flavobacterium gilvum]AOW08540.1 cell envelope biogenesis protein OmpA [Flavobacterium gilvum]KFC58829.1 cell envelope biogenesis protein OmpA [Flavobacterium gilvum]